MKKIVSILFLIVTLLGCQKEKTDPVMLDVAFAVIHVDPGAGMKSAREEFSCNANFNPDYAEIDIKGQGTFYPPVFSLDGKLYTEAIQLAAGNHTITKFVLKDDMTGDGPSNEDQVCLASPEAASPYAGYISTDVNYAFTVAGAINAEITMEVLCFKPSDRANFGFDWYDTPEIVIREHGFYGTICVDPADYAGSFYENQPGGVKAEMPAVIKVVVKKDGEQVPGSPFRNSSWYGVEKPLVVQYPDNLAVTNEIFQFDVYIWVKSTCGFGYQHYRIFTVTDEQPIVTGQSGIVDFCIGGCMPEAYYQWEWMPMPDCTVDLIINP